MFGSRTGDVEGRRGATGAGWTDGPGIRCLGHEETGAAGTHFHVSVAVFFWAFGPRLGDVEAGRSIGGDGRTDGRGLRFLGHE
jgi:hypothetical protein